MQSVLCPVKGCRRRYRVHDIAPDEAYLELMWHYFTAHPNRCPLELLDSTDEIKVANGE